jgi:hypothetical protein
VARMVIAALIGFAIAAQFVSLWALEIPYYVVLIGGATLRFSSEEGSTLKAANAKALPRETSGDHCQGSVRLEWPEGHLIRRVDANQ